MFDALKRLCRSDSRLKQFLVIGLLAPVLSSGPLQDSAQAQNKAKVERQFQSWLAKEIWPRARAEGVSRRTFDRAFAGVTLNWKLPGLVPPGSPPPKKRKQRQSEFGSPGKYFNSGTVNSATRIGQQMAGQLSQTLTNIERHSGATRVTIDLRGHKKGATMRITDNGRRHGARERIFCCHGNRCAIAIIPARKPSATVSTGPPRRPRMAGRCHFF